MPAAELINKLAIICIIKISSIFLNINLCFPERRGDPLGHEDQQGMGKISAIMN